MNSKYTYIVYYRTKVDSIFHCYNLKTKDFSEVNYETFNELYFKNTGKYEAPKYVEASKEGLMNFGEQYIQDAAELLKENGYLNIFFGFTNGLNLVNIFTQTLEYYGKNYEWTKLKGNAIEAEESRFQNDCYNAGIVFVKIGTYNCFGYDFKMFYPTIMGSEDFMFPVCEGRSLHCKPSILTKPLAAGNYRCLITSAHPLVGFVFAFSGDNTYNSYSLAFAIKYQAEFNFTITLIEDGEPNAYIYEKAVMRTGKSLFGKWLEQGRMLRAKYPHNKYLKYIMSGLWGQLCYQPRHYITGAELKSGDYDDAVIVGEIGDFENPTYKVLNGYKYNCRIKSFLTAYARNKTAEIAMKNLAHVVRIHTDGIVYNAPLPKELYPADFIPEEKTTGAFEWLSKNTKKVVIIIIAKRVINHKKKLNLRPKALAVVKSLY